MALASVFAEEMKHLSSNLSFPIPSFKLLIHECANCGRPTSKKLRSEASKMHFFLPPFSLQQAHVLKNSLGVRNQHPPDRNEGVNKNTNQEFPYKIAVVYLGKYMITYNSKASPSL